MGNILLWEWCYYEDKDKEGGNDDYTIVKEFTEFMSKTRFSKKMLHTHLSILGVLVETPFYDSNYGRMTTYLSFWLDKIQSQRVNPR